MAQGDFSLFDQFLVDVLEGLHDLETDDIRLALITNAVTPTITDGDPRFGTGGTTNFKTNEVAAGGNYAADGASAANPAVTLTGGLAEFDADDVSWAQNASNPTNARWGILFNFTDAGKRCIGFGDPDQVVNMTTGTFTFTWNANGIFRLDQA